MVSAGYRRPASAKIDTHTGRERRWYGPRFGKLRGVVGKVREAAALGGRQRVEIVGQQRIEKRSNMTGKWHSSLHRL
jgi:hypothetical protein